MYIYIVTYIYPYIYKYRYIYIIYRYISVSQYIRVYRRDISEHVMLFFFGTLYAVYGDKYIPELFAVGGQQGCVSLSDQSIFSQYDPEYHTASRCT